MVTKEYMLSHKSFIDNNYLSMYIELINNSVIDEGYSDVYTIYKHHIIPKAYFNLNKIDIDNTSNNIVELTYKNHILAHYYLYKCTDGYLKSKMFFAIMCLINLNMNKNVNNLIDDHFICNIIENISDDKFKIKFTDEHSKKISLAEKGKIVSNESRSKMSLSWDYDSHFGPNTITRENLSKAIKGKKKSIQHVKHISESLIGHDVSYDVRVKLSKSRSNSKGLLDYYTIINDNNLINDLIDTYYYKGYSISYCCNKFNIGSKVCTKVLKETGYYEGFDHKKMSKCRGIYKGEVYNDLK